VNCCPLPKAQPGRGGATVSECLIDILADCCHCTWHHQPAGVVSNMCQAGEGWWFVTPITHALYAGSSACHSPIAASSHGKGLV